VKQLLTQLAAAGGAGTRLHLVGHSTGGLDAELLFFDPLFDTVKASTEELRRVRAAVRSVTTIASPLAGTTLADSPLARLLAIEDLRDVVAALRSQLLAQAPGAFVGLAASILGSVGGDSLVTSVIHGVIQGRSAFAAYVLALLMRRALIGDLQPAHMQAMLAKKTPSGELDHVRTRHFLTVARKVPDRKPAGNLFRELDENLVTAARREPDTEVAAIAAQLRELCDSQGVRVIGYGAVPVLDEAAADGVVNTARQIFRDPALREQELARVAAVVIADHIDVVGYYQGKNGAEGGFLSSGSLFRDPEFNALFDCVAAEIRAAIPHDV